MTAAPLLSLALASEHDVVLARQRARQVAAALRFEEQDQTRVATAVSEVARHAWRAGGTRLQFLLTGTTAPQVLVVRIGDPRVAAVGRALGGARRREPLPPGVDAARRLVDQLELVAAPDGATAIVLTKLLPRGSAFVGARELAAIADGLLRQPPRNVLEEVQQQNQELLRALDDLARRQQELGVLNRELEDTNRGVVALYAELDEKADHLRRADEIKTRFLSNMTHEFRTPVNSIRALARLLLERVDGELSAEQERQVRFILQAADGLGELVDDLLDLAKVEAGKTIVRPAPFDVATLFGTLRGMLRPLLVNESVALVFEEPTGVPTLHTDEAKVSQILRNFVSNALKFTERGEIRVAARPLPDGRHVAFVVRDTGIGIAPGDLARIFTEFDQLEHPIQQRVRGTGLGLPLCRRLAELLGGHLEVESEPGTGSTFTAVLPAVFAPRVAAPPVELDADRVPVLVVEDCTETVRLYERFLSGTQFQPVGAATLPEAREQLARVRPRAIVLDVVLSGEDAWSLLTELKRSDVTRGIPVLVLTTLDEEQKALALGADAFCRKPVERHQLQQMLVRLTAPERARRILVVDDDDVARYIVRQYLAAPEHLVLEASSGTEALALARRERPDLICLDLVMPPPDGAAVLAALRADAATRDIPVLVVTSRPLDDGERRAIEEQGAVVLRKGSSREHVLAAVAGAFQVTGHAAA